MWFALEHAHCISANHQCSLKLNIYWNCCTVGQKIVFFSNFLRLIWDVSWHGVWGFKPIWLEFYKNCVYLLVTPHMKYDAHAPSHFFTVFSFIWKNTRFTSKLGQNYPWKWIKDYTNVLEKADKSSIRGYWDMPRTLTNTSHLKTWRANAGIKMRGHI